MRITKFVHSCLLVEMPAPVNRTALFDPGGMSEDSFSVDMLEYLDDIFITHGHGDHLSHSFLAKLIAKFPHVRITAPSDVVAELKDKGITASDQAPEGVVFFDSPHEDVAPLFQRPEEIGIHYLDKLTDPGDSHSFNETKPVLALPVQGPWGATTAAVKLALKLKPQYIVPIHDWHWSDAAREQMYGILEQRFKEEGITFLPLKTGEPVTVDA